MPLRYYVETADGRLLRLSLEFMEHKRSIKWLAGHSLRIIEIIHTPPPRCVVHRNSGFFGSVDADGFLVRSYGDAVLAAMELADTSARTKRMKIPDVGQLRKRQIAFDKHRWKPSPAQLDSIKADLNGARSISLASRQKT